MLGKYYFNSGTSWQWKGFGGDNNDLTSQQSSVISALQGKGICIDPKENIIFIRSGVKGSKYKNYSILYTSLDSLISKDNSHRYVDYIFNDIDEKIEAQKNSLHEIDYDTLLTSVELNEEDLIACADKNLIILVVDKILSGDSVVLNGSDGNRAKKIIYYALSCIPPTLANTLTINTDIASDANLESQFIGYTANAYGTTRNVAKKISYLDLTVDTIDSLNNYYAAYLGCLIEQNNYSGLLTLWSAVCLSENEEITNYIDNLNVIAGNYIAILDDSITILESVKINNDKIVTIFSSSVVSEGLKNNIKSIVKRYDAIAFLTLCVRTNIEPDIIESDIVTIRDGRALCAEDFDIISEFYEKYSLDAKSINYVKSVFTKCIEKIGTVKYNGELFNSVYKARVYCGGGENEKREDVGVGFLNYFCEGLLITSAIDSKQKKARRIGDTIEERNGSRQQLWVTRGFIPMCAVSVIIALIIGMLLCCNFTDKICTYFALQLNTNLWKVKIVFAFAIIIYYFLVYYLPYIVMRKTTVHLNGFSNGFSTVISGASCVLALIVPILIAIILGNAV